MNPIVLAYILNTLVLIPVGLLTLLGGEAGNRRVFQDKFPESEDSRLCV